MPECDPWNPHKGGQRKPVAQRCPLTFARVHTSKSSIYTIVFFKGKKEPGEITVPVIPVLGRWRQKVRCSR